MYIHIYDTLKQRPNRYVYTYTESTGCNTLQHTATHCNTSQHTATHCNTLQQTVYISKLDNEQIVKYIRIQSRAAAIRCNTLQHTATHCNTL